jgi:hypothetical protein
MYADKKNDVTESNAGSYKIKLCNMSYGLYIFEQFNLKYPESITLI